MIQVDEYFGGKVKSLGVNRIDGKATVGVMAPGEYEFGTSTTEIMKVVSGSMTVKLPGESDWRVYNEGDSYTVGPNQKFQLKIATDCAYLCLYK